MSAVKKSTATKPKNQRKQYTPRISREAKQYVRQLKDDSRQARDESLLNDPAGARSARLRPMSDMPKTTAEHLKVMEEKFTEGMLPGMKRLWRVSTMLRRGIVPHEPDAAFVAVAFEHIVNGRKPSEALEIEGRQYQGRKTRSPDVTHERARIGALVAQEMESLPYDRAVDKVAKKLEEEEGHNPRARNDLRDPTIGSWVRFVEDCHKEFRRARRRSGIGTGQDDRLASTANGTRPARKKLI